MGLRREFEISGSRVDWIREEHSRYFVACIGDNVWSSGLEFEGNVVRI